MDVTYASCRCGGVGCGRANSGEDGTADAGRSEGGPEPREEDPGEDGTDGAGQSKGGPEPRESIWFRERSGGALGGLREGWGGGPGGDGGARMGDGGGGTRGRAGGAWRLPFRLAPHGGGPGGGRRCVKGGRQRREVVLTNSGARTAAQGPLRTADGGAARATGTTAGEAEEEF